MNKLKIYGCLWMSRVMLRVFIFLMWLAIGISMAFPPPTELYRRKSNDT